MSRTGELAVALVLDAWLGEPPLRIHPVVGVGRLLDVLEARLPAPDTPGGAVAGALAWTGGAGAVLAVAALARRLPWPLRGAALWGLFSGRLLLAEVAAVEEALLLDGLPGGRERIARLVSRDTTMLDAGAVRGAAVSTLAENVADSVVASLWWWTVGGLPGAALHRWADTADSRWGYRTPAWEQRGRVAARADDLLAWVPARLTALAWRGRLDAPLRAEAARTPSPNGGWPMGAAALGLDVRLEKPGSYALHPTGAEPGPRTVPTALGEARRVLSLVAAVTLGVAACRDLRGAT